jgi:hypothetical protein
MEKNSSAKIFESSLKISLPQNSELLGIGTMNHIEITICIASINLHILDCTYTYIRMLAGVSCLLWCKNSTLCRLFAHLLNKALQLQFWLYKEG